MTKPLGKAKKARSFGGCKGCKQAKRKCPEEHPQCSICEKLGLKCQYDLNFLFRCEMVDFSGHISKAARITRPDPVKRKDRGKSPPLEHPPSPHKIIQFEFIDEYPALMSDTYHYERTPTPSPPPTSVESPNTALGLLLEAANVSDGGSSDSRIGMPTPPLSPSDSVVLPVPYMSQSVKSMTRKSPSPGSLEFILN